MYQVTGWKDLEQFGVQSLTGEACGLNRRMLCDVTKRASEAIQGMLGLPGGLTNRPWNGGMINGEEKAGSLMIPYSVISEVAVWLMRAHGVKDIAIYDGVVYGRELDDPAEEWENTVKHLRSMCRQANQNTPRPTRLGWTSWREVQVAIVCRSNHPGVGDRNEHAASGRVT